MTDSLSTRVIFAVAESVGCDPTTLTPITDVIDPDALDSIFADHEGDDLVVQFQYEDRQVRVSGNGQVTVEPGVAEPE